ncbi:MAG TPA: LLM class flavin-dependent oxidoreductase [Solirubrobacteraceae bacterium]|nr:LLM class flavin-dependent oxidoreductase [Solirubrobacteraceae bacterium]
MRVSVLDQSPISEGQSGPDALAHTLELARLAERLGFHRFWVAEHHGGPMLAGAAPEVLLGAIGSHTQEIRIGSGGVMLPHYSPLKVAETFTLLAGLYPGRVDLGLGRAAGTDPLTTYALQRDRRQAAPDDFPDQLTELLGYLDGTLPEDHPFRRLGDTLPGQPQRPEPWLLGSSAQSAIWAGQLGLPYMFADFIAPFSEPLGASYREHFAAAGHPGHRSARMGVALWAIVAETEEEARYLAAPARMSFRLLRQGQLIKVPSPETALDYLAKVGQARESWIPGRRALIGTPEQVRSGLEAAAAAYGAEEVMVVTITHDHAARMRSYELLAEVCDLGPRLTGSGAAAF